MGRKANRSQEKHFKNRNKLNTFRKPEERLKKAIKVCHITGNCTKFEERVKAKWYE